MPAVRLERHHLGGTEKRKDMVGSKKDNAGEPSALRKSAEEKTAQSPENTGVLLPGQTRQTLHELQVHQVELEMQNEELRKSQSELESVRARYFDLYNLAPLGYCTVSEKGLILKANLTTATLLGEPKDALLNQPISRFILKEHQDIYYLHRKKLFETYQPQTFELQMVKKDGTAFWARMMAAVIQNDRGCPQSCQIILDDITERKRTEEALRETNAYLENLLNYANVPIIVWDPQFRITRFNHAFELLTGRREKDVVGNSLVMLFPPELIENSMALIRETLTGERWKTVEIKILHLDESVRTVLWNSATLFAADCQTPIATIAQGNDITERKRAEEELFRQKVLLASILESSSEAIFAKDIAGKYVSINESGARMLGHRVADMIGRTDAELLPAEMANEFWETDKSVMSSGQAHEREVPCEINGNTYVYFTHKAPWMDSSGKNIGVVGIANDMTERKRLNAEKAKIEVQLEKIDSLTRMSASVAHHFNNKLHVVMGYLEMVIGNMPQSDSRTIKLERALQSARKASEVSGNLLAYVGKTQEKIELLDLAELCRISLPVLQTGKPENVALKTDLSAPGPLISADAKQIQQILTNLAINAWEAVGDKVGTVRLTVKKVPSTDIPASHRFPTEWQPRKQNYACLEVTDSGCGVQEKDMDKIFDPFFTTKFTGRGLGLSIVLGIVKTHGAGITIESRIARGSVFRVFFPMSEKMADGHDKQVNKAPDIVAGGTVLLVEDEAAVLEMTAITLESLGFTVLQAKDGIEAVEIFKQHKDEISCLLCDLAMPRMNGWETISALRAIRHDLPAILASGYDEVSVMAGEHPEMPDVFLNKPYETRKLGDMIRQAMAGRGDRK